MAARSASYSEGSQLSIPRVMALMPCDEESQGRILCVVDATARDSAQPRNDDATPTGVLCSSQRVRKKLHDCDDSGIAGPSNSAPCDSSPFAAPFSTASEVRVARRKAAAANGSASSDRGSRDFGTSGSRPIPQTHTLFRMDGPAVAWKPTHEAVALLCNLSAFGHPYQHSARAMLKLLTWATAIWDIADRQTLPSSPSPSGRRSEDDCGANFSLTPSPGPDAASHPNKARRHAASPGLGQRTLSDWRALHPLSLSSSVPEMRLVKQRCLEGLARSLRHRWPEELLRCSDEDFSVTRIREMYVRNLKRATSGLRLQASGVMIPHPQKKTGEDCLFTNSACSAVGVADGVSEWRSYGVDPRLFAEQLMRGCDYAASQWKDVVHGGVASGASIASRAQRILECGYRGVSSYGGSTATVACIDDLSGSVLEISHIGDSTLAVFRRDPATGLMECVFRTAEMQHSFNTPYQLMRLPELRELSDLRDTGQTDLVRVTLKVRFGGMCAVDTTEDTTAYRVPIREGDLLILGTDGLFDNLHEEEIAELATLAISPAEAKGSLRAPVCASAASVASLLVKMAHFRSQDQCAVIPFFLNAQKAGVLRQGQQRVGGKPDDIAVVACWVVAETELTPARRCRGFFESSVPASV